ncbi:MAG: 4-hydroxy-tetrahydrodipicolinate synthase [Alphaproteobacteria bacterium]|nr:4-hydroxy-tetrahydrodipicolinate synthase [Alphaproteobacteria bacterium]NCQ87612.1 4-hydroxy-tetrahydrodipicolinate synthase [Alphaproteobacteria bacterium]NCT05879.1 4-hydroxy-tetrahydrodipicolinate synthase [Alphaproteobacteria bacterium]
MYKGSITALITPFKNGEIDWKAFDHFVEWQIEQGTHGVVPCGTTGESPTLSHDEHKKIIKRCVEIVAKRIPVIAGSGSNSTAEAIELTTEAMEDGADAALVVTPYYNKPTQDGLYAHYKVLNDIGIPVIIYNIPGRSVVDMSNQTVARLALLPNIIGIKDATADLARPLELRHLVGDDFCQLSGEDATATGFLAQGGHGCISVASNVAPALCAQQHEAWQKGDIKTMEQCRDTLAPLHKALFVESSPAPVKYAASQLGLCSDEVRLPLMTATANCRAVIDHALDFAGLRSDKAKAAQG